MSNSRKVYLLDPQELPPETIAVTFAKTSRSPESFRQIAAELSEEKSSRFHEKWVVGYGHSSVAEHAVLHIATENISRLAVETLESGRLASYTEKSTRYQKWDSNSFHTPNELTDDFCKKEFIATCTLLFDTYQKLLPVVQKLVENEMPPEKGESLNSWKRRIHSEPIDVCRYLLPAASLANVGTTINARALEHLLRKMLSHPLDEVRTLGEEIKKEALKSVPTLVKYADPVPYLSETGKIIQNWVAALPHISDQEMKCCNLVDFDQQGENKLLTAALFRYSNFSYAQAREVVEQADETTRKELLNLLLGKLDKFDIPIRELEHYHFSFEIILDQGAYFELKRHRMMTQSPQDLTTNLGFVIPRRISAAGVEEEYITAMEKAQSTYQIIAEQNPFAASYIVPNAYNRRILLTLNYRSVDHFLKLRSDMNAHFSIRRIAQKMGEIIREKMPLLGTYLRLLDTETWQSIEKEHFKKC